ncbi:MAG TPA: hypothetical protein VFJ05_04155 [Nitrososphaeraceae archaeon]|nr:hypothetical protein [Nitrososphaeraceae archaeon]
MWFPKGKLVNNDSLLKTLNDDRKNELFGIFDELEKNHQKITKDIIRILTTDKPERTLNYNDS